MECKLTNYPLNYTRLTHGRAFIYKIQLNESHQIKTAKKIASLASDS